MKELAFEELRSQFERELLRKDSLESKASYIVGIIAIFLPLLLNFSLEILRQGTSPVKFWIIFILIINLILIAVILYFSIKILYVTKVRYPIPSSDPNKLNEFYFKNEDLEDDVKDRYFDCISSINLDNNEKASKLSKCFILIVISTVLSMILFILGLL